MSDEVVSVSVNGQAFNRVVKDLLAVAMREDPMTAGAALLSAWVLQSGGYDLGEQESVSKDVVTMVNEWSAILQQRV